MDPHHLVSRYLYEGGDVFGARLSSVDDEIRVDRRYLCPSNGVALQAALLDKVACACAVGIAKHASTGRRAKRLMLLATAQGGFHILLDAHNLPAGAGKLALNDDLVGRQGRATVFPRNVGREITSLTVSQAERGNRHHARTDPLGSIARIHTQRATERTRRSHGKLQAR